MLELLADNLGHGVRYEWLLERRILAFQVANVSRLAIDTWVTAIDTAVTGWEVGKPVLLMHEIAALPLTPYTKKRSEYLSKKYAHLKGRNVVVLKPSIFSAIIRIFMEREVAKISSGFQRRVFTSREEALQWLSEGLV